MLPKSYVKTLYVDNFDPESSSPDYLICINYLELYITLFSRQTLSLPTIWKPHLPCGSARMQVNVQMNREITARISTQKHDSQRQHRWRVDEEQQNRFSHHIDLPKEVRGTRKNTPPQPFWCYNAGSTVWWITKLPSLVEVFPLYFPGKPQRALNTEWIKVAWLPSRPPQDRMPQQGIPRVARWPGTTFQAVNTKQQLTPVSFHRNTFTNIRI